MILLSFAAPLFSRAENLFNEDLTQRLEAHGFTVFLPQRDGVENTPRTLDTLSNQCDLVEVLQEKAQGHTILWQPLKALDIYAITDTLRPFRPLRDMGSYTIVKAQANTYAGEMDEGVTYAIRGLEMAQQYQSKRHISRIQGMYDRLSMTPLGRSAKMKELHTVRLEM